MVTEIRQQSSPAEIADRFKCQEVQAMVVRHMSELHQLGLISLYNLEQEFPIAYSHLDQLFIKDMSVVFFIRRNSTRYNYPLMVAHDTLTPSSDHTELSRLSLVKVSPKKGEILHASQMEITGWDGTPLPAISDNALNAIHRHYEEQTALGILLEQTYTVRKEVPLRYR